MLDQLRKFVAPELITGIGARTLAGQYARNLGLTRVLLVSDSGIAQAGWTDEICHELNAVGIEYSLFMELTPNPKDYEVHSGVEAYNANKCDGLVAIGGGSVIDCAKGIGIIANNSGNIVDYEGVDTIKSACPPLVSIPTTSGASADVSQFAIIADSSRKVKMAIVSKALVPDVSLIDPQTTTSMDSELTANTGMDALTHSMEALVSNASSSITTLHALESIRLIQKSLKAAYDNGKDIEARSGMMLGSLHAGLAFSNASLGAVHAMAHALGGFYDLPHGLCNAILLPHVIEYNFSAANDEYQQICKFFSPDCLDGKDTLIKSITNLMHSVGVTETLAQLDVNKEDFPDLAELAIQDACMATNPKSPELKEIIEIYANAY